MQKRISRAAKYFAIAAIPLVLAFAMLIFSFQPKPAPPLPFNTNAFVSTVNFLENIGNTPPANETFFGKCRRLLFRASFRLEGNRPSSSSFPASPRFLCGVQPLLNDCMVVTSTRYLMPIEIAAGSVTFGHTNTLDGPHYVAAVENVLEHDMVEFVSKGTNRTGDGIRQEHLKFLRFPEQKAVVVLPESEVADFLRTNGIKALE